MTIPNDRMNLFSKRKNRESERDTDTRLELLDGREIDKVIDLLGKDEIVIRLIRNDNYSEQAVNEMGDIRDELHL